MITDEEKQEVIELYEKNTPKSHIANKTSVSRSKVVEICKEYDKTKNKPAANPLQAPVTTSASAPASVGDIAAKAFEMFRNGFNPIEVVIKLKISPETAEHLFEEYHKIEDLEDYVNNLYHEKVNLEDQRDKLGSQVIALKILKKGRYRWWEIMTPEGTEGWAIAPEQQ